MKIKFISLILVVLSGCAPYKRHTFKTDTFLSAGKIKKYEIFVPRGYMGVNTDLRKGILKEYQYRDSMMFYISADVTFVNSPNYVNWSKCPEINEKKKCESGRSTAGLFWKEIVSQELVIGYKNVDSASRGAFDIALSSLIDMER